jgi:2-oxoglutarate dehydrogenase E2 component (dihydrolipoamide succinyltransferase)
MNLGDRPEQRVPMSRLRARIAERLVQSQSTNAILTTFNEVNMAPVMEMRKKFQEKFEKEHGVKLGFMSFFVKAAVAALKKYPVINASVDGNDIVYHGYFDIGIAVGFAARPGGAGAAQRRPDELCRHREEDRRVRPEGEGRQAGHRGTDRRHLLHQQRRHLRLDAVHAHHQPAAEAILGVHATKDRAVVENGQVVVRPINYLAMSYDHRIIDGREAVLGLVTMKEALEDPARLLFDI